MTLFSGFAGGSAAARVDGQQDVRRIVQTGLYTAMGAALPTMWGSSAVAMSSLARLIRRGRVVSPRELSDMRLKEPPGARKFAAVGAAAGAQFGGHLGRRAPISPQMGVQAPAKVLQNTVHDLNNKLDGLNASAENKFHENRSHLATLASAAPTPSLPQFGGGVPRRAGGTP